MLLFLCILIFYSIIHTIQYIHPPPLAEVPLHLLIAGGKNLPGVPSRGIELGPALQQAIALSFALRRSLAMSHPEHTKKENQRSTENHFVTVAVYI